MELPPAQSGQDYTTPNLEGGQLTVWINGSRVTPIEIAPMGNNKFTYKIAGSDVQPPGPIIFKDGDTPVATAEIIS